jgi:NIMA (never in mitosis gene a)-related kinase
MEHYEIVSTIGKGSFGVVYKVKRLVDAKIFACKEINYGNMSDKEKQQLVSEVNILRELDHPNIVKYYERIIDKKNTKICLIMEFCQGGDLSQMLRKCRRDMDYIAEDVVWKVFSQLVVGLGECHNRPIGAGRVLHRDLKPANVLLDQSNSVKLGDFGLARILHENSLFCKTHVGTPYYMSPEQVDEAHYDEKSDIWSAGCLLYELAALRSPFEATNFLALALKIKVGKFDRLPLRYSEDLQSLVEWMLSINPTARPTVTELYTIP